MRFLRPITRLLRRSRLNRAHWRATGGNGGTHVVRQDSGVPGYLMLASPECDKSEPFQSLLPLRTKVRPRRLVSSSERLDLLLTTGLVTKRHGPIRRDRHSHYES